MKINLEALKALVEAGDASAIETHILNEALEKTDVYGVLEKGDIVAAAEINEAVKSELDSEKDKHHTKAFKKFETEKLPNLLNAAKEDVRKEFNKDETPEQKEIRDLKEAFIKEKEKNVRAEVRSKLLSLATGEEIGLDAAFISKHIDKFVPKSIQVNEAGEYDVEGIITTVKDELKGLSTDFGTVVSAQVEQKLKIAARDDLGGGVGAGQQKKESLGEKLAKQTNQKDAKEQQSKFFGQ